MEALEKIKNFIENLEEKKFYKYLIGTLGILILILMLIVFRHYRTVQRLKKRINSINEIREEEVKKILHQADLVEKQRKEVDAMLAEDEDFKIGGYLKNLLEKLGLSDKKTVESPSQIDREDNYRESILAIKFTDMDMKQLTELLNEIEQTRRIYTKELEIMKSRKTPDKLEVNITIATLLLKAE